MYCHLYTGWWNCSQLLYNLRKLICEHLRMSFKAIGVLGEYSQKKKGSLCLYFLCNYLVSVSFLS